MQPKQEYGWVIIDTEEKREVFEPRQSADDIRLADKWVNLQQDYPPRFGETLIYRRRIQPGEGFEIVAEGEHVSGMVESTRDGINWGKYCFLSSRTAKEESQHYTGILAFRRPIKQSLPAPVEQTPWRPIGDLTGLPESGVVLIGHSDKWGQGVDSVLASDVRKGAISIHTTHWQPIAPVPRPPKPMTEEEAFKAICRRQVDPKEEAGVIAGWLAHIEFIKKGGGK